MHTEYGVHALRCRLSPLGIMLCKVVSKSFLIINHAFLAEAQFMNLLDASGFGVATDAKPSDNVLASGRMAEFFLLDI
uniref:Uncharacterized protein n=1 Tax=Aspergillus fumigatus TaxID=746128 RepID=Q6MYB4_ASPFM|nr:hypothetical protein AfA35g10.21 [Aspergillus fumigatus]